MPSSGFTEIVSREGTGPIDPNELPEQESAPARLSEAERAAAFRQAEPKIPRKFALIVVAILVVLALSGTVLEHLLSSVGLNPDSATAGQSTVTSSGALFRSQ